MTELLDETTAAKLAQEAADADAEAAEATAAAAHARSRADRLRRKAQKSTTEINESPEPDEAAAGSSRRRRWPGLACAIALVLLIAATGAASGYIVWEHRVAARDRQLTADFAAAARQAAITLMSMNFQNAKQDVQRIVADSTGEFHDDFARQADDFTKVVEQSKAVTTTKVNSTAVQAMTADSATVLVAATSEVTNSAGAHQEPRAWRLLVDVKRDGGQLKMSKVEFVP